MNGLRPIDGFIVLLALCVGVVGCSDYQSQHGTGSGLSSASESETKPAEGQAERTDKGETEPAEPAEEKTEEEVVEIPLDQIWAFNMPGTRDVRELEPDKFGKVVKELTSAEQLRLFGESLTSQILQSLPSLKSGQKAKQGFAVLGIGADALREARAVLVESRQPQVSFPAGKEISLVFFSHSFGYYVHLNEVERQGSTIRIRYRFVPHRTKEMTRHFALIPLGELSPVKLTVEITRSPMEKALMDAGFKAPEASTELQVVAQSFEFVIEETND